MTNELTQSFILGIEFLIATPPNQIYSHTSARHLPKGEMIFFFGVSSTVCFVQCTFKIVDVVFVHVQQFYSAL